MAPKLPPELLVEEIDIALEISPPGPGIRMLERLIPLLSAEQNENFLANLLPAEWSQADLARIFTNMAVDAMVFPPVHTFKTYFQTD